MAADIMTAVGWGDDPARSVTDPYGRVWGHENVRIAGGSVHVTHGGVNPLLTILAGSLRIAENLAGAQPRGVSDAPQD
jgi:choline dehydrogenase-like flavoprotein